MIRVSLPPRTQRLLARTLAVAGAAVLVITGAFLATNLVVMPRLTARAAASFSGACGCAVEIRRAGYGPLRGVVLRGVSLGFRADGNRSPAAVDERRPDVVMTAGRIRLRVPLRAVRAVRRAQDASAVIAASLPAAGRPSLLDVVPFMLGALRSLAEEGVLPRSVAARNVTVRLDGGTAMELAADRVVLAHDRRAGEVLLTARPAGATESGIAGITGRAGVSYRANSLDGWAEIGGLRIAAGPVTDGLFSGRLAVSSANGRSFALEGAVALEDATLAVPAVAEERMSTRDLRWSFAALLDNGGGGGTRGGTRGGTLLFTESEITVNGITIEVRPAITGLPGEPGLLSVVVHLPVTPVRRILESVPAAVSGPLSRTEVRGTLGWDLDLRVPLSEISDMSWNAEARLSEFAVLAIDPRMNVFRMNGELTHTIRDPEVGYERTVRIPAARPASMEWMLLHSEHTERQIERIRAENRRIALERPDVKELPEPAGRDPGPPSPDPAYRYVRVDDLSPWVVRAVLTAEDGDFFFYGGVNPVTLADAIERNIREGGIVLGASTISMQLAKMLFLDQERVFSRKLQEVFLVYLMEHQVPVSKERILELYLNLAEFGPGVYGIADAARYYFGKDPADLTAGEATWLASILPSPKTYHRYFEDGRISDAWFARMIGLYDIMLERGRMSEEEYQAAVAARPVFRGR